MSDEWAERAARGFAADGPSPAEQRLARRVATVRDAAGPDAHRKTVSIDRACALAGVSRRAIYNWMGLGRLEYIRTAGGSVRIFADTLWRRGDDRLRKEPPQSQPRAPRAQAPVAPAPSCRQQVQLLIEQFGLAAVLRACAEHLDPR